MEWTHHVNRTGFCRQTEWCVELHPGLNQSGARAQVLSVVFALLTEWWATFTMPNE